MDTMQAHTPVVDRLKELLLRLPVPNQVNLKYLLSFFANWVEESNSQIKVPELLGSYLIRLRSEDVPASYKGQTSDVILKIFEDFLASMNELPFPTDAAFADFVKNNNAQNAASTDTVPRIPVTVLDKDDAAVLLTSVENSRLVLDLNDIAPSTSPPPSGHRHMTSVAGLGFDADNEARNRTDSGGSSKGIDGCGEEEEPGMGPEGYQDSPRKEKHSSTRARASNFFRMFRKSISTKKRNFHVSAPAQPGTPDEDATGSEGCGTPTSSAPSGSFTPSAPIAVPKSKRDQRDLPQSPKSPKSPKSPSGPDTEDCQSPESK